MTVLRINAKNILYTAVNSNAVNSEVLGYKNPLWVNALIIFDVIVVAGLAVWGVFAIRGALKKKEDNITIE
jgi:hypothetical protein